MSQDNHLRDGFSLGEWTIEPELGRVTCDGRRFQIEPKIMDALVLLAEEYPRVVCKATFLDKVWGDVNVVNHVVARAISELRRVFGDDARNPQFIETIPKTGYRLVTSPVYRPAATQRIQTAEARPRRERTSYLAVGAMVAIGIVFVWGIVATTIHGGFMSH